MSSIGDVKAMLDNVLNTVENFQAVMNEARTKMEESQGGLLLILGDDSGNEAVTQTFAVTQLISERVDEIQGLGQAVYDGVLAYRNSL